MLKKIYFLLIIMIMAIFSVSCNDDSQNDSKTCSPECNSWEKCEEAKCILLDNRCNKNDDCKEEFKCNEETHECQEDNKEECINNTTKCEENTLLTCNNNTWESLDCTIENKICKIDEKNASCVEEIIETCTQDATKCEGNNLLTCNNNIWESFNCADKICKTEEEISSCVAEEIQELTIEEVKALTSSKTVITSGVVTYINIYDNKVAGFYMQESQNDNGAIYVFIKDGVNSNLKLGDTVKVTGLAWKRFGVVRIGDNEYSPSFEITDLTSTIPEPLEISSTELKYGNVDMLLDITNTNFTVKTLGDAPLYHTILTDENDNELIINSKLYRFNENGLTVGSIVSKITGIAGSYQNNDESFIFLIRPRTESDIIFTNDGTEGHICRDTDPKCNEGLKCVENLCEIRLPCDDSCTDTQYCNEETDICVDLTLKTISEVRALTDDTLVMVEGVVTQYKRHNQTTANFYIQDATTPNSGIQIYYKNAQAPSVSIGSKIRVVGIAHMYQNIIEIGTADEQPEITTLEYNLETTPKQIDSTEITEENLYILVELQNPPFTVTVIEDAHPKYVTFTDNLGNTFMLNNDWVNDWVYFYDDDVLTSLKGLISYRISSGVTFTINPRTEDDFTFQGE